MYHLMDTLSGLCTGEEVQQLKSDIDGETCAGVPSLTKMSRA